MYFTYISIHYQLNIYCIFVTYYRVPVLNIFDTMAMTRFNPSAIQQTYLESTQENLHFDRYIYLISSDGILARKRHPRQLRVQRNNRARQVHRARGQLVRVHRQHVRKCSVR